MFGNDNSKSLLLPIIYDLAKLIQKAFKKQIIFANSGREITFTPPFNNIHDDTLQVETPEPIVKDIRNSTSIIKAEPLTSKRINTNLTKTHLAMQEIEELALKNLNGTFDTEKGLKDSNGSIISPMALIDHHYKKRTQHLFNRKPGPHPETCERFTGT